MAPCQKTISVGHINCIIDEYKVNYCGCTRTIGSHLVLILFEIESTGLSCYLMKNKAIIIPIPLLRTG